MHACGYDLHTAGLVGAARLLHAHRDRLAGDVVVMFQPGEEGCNGAAVMIDEGVLDASGTRAMDELRGSLGEDRVQLLEQPIMPSEDFSFVLREVPGTYLMFGVERTDVPAERQGNNHSPFDDSVLGDQAALLVHLAVERLAKATHTV